MLTCEPEPNDLGSHSFDVEQIALEHPLAAKTTSITFEVIEGVEEVEEVVWVLANSLPFFEAPAPEVVEITKTIEATTWKYVLPEAVDLDEEDTSVAVSAKMGAASTFL